MTRKLTGKAAKMIDELVAKHGKHVLTPDELAEVRANPSMDDDIGPPPLKAKVGRPRKGTSQSPTVGKTVKQTAEYWRVVEAKAKARGMTVHEAMREALDKWLAA